MTAVLSYEWLHHGAQRMVIQGADHRLITGAIREELEEIAVNPAPQHWPKEAGELQRRTAVGDGGVTLLGVVEAPSTTEERCGKQGEWLRDKVYQFIHDSQL